MSFNYDFYCTLCFVNTPSHVKALELYFQILIKENHYPNLYMNDFVICGITCNGVNLQEKTGMNLLNTKWVSLGRSLKPHFLAESD